MSLTWKYHDSAVLNASAAPAVVDLMTLVAGYPTKTRSYWFLFYNRGSAYAEVKKSTTTIGNGVPRINAGQNAQIGPIHGPVMTANEWTLSGTLGAVVNITVLVGIKV